MRTKKQHDSEDAMFAQVKAALMRRSPSFLEDALGVVSLFVLLFVGLTLSGAA